MFSTTQERIGISDLIFPESRNFKPILTVRGGQISASDVVVRAWGLWKKSLRLESKVSS